MVIVRTETEQEREERLAVARGELITVKAEAKKATVTVTTEKELAAAIQADEATITVTGDLAKKTIKIHATGSAAWAVVAAGLLIAAGAAFVTMGSGGTASPATVPAAAISGIAATSIMGVGATTSAISVILACGGVSAGMKALTSLRKYKVTEKSEGLLVLKRR